MIEIQIQMERGDIPIGPTQEEHLRDSAKESQIEQDDDDGEGKGGRKLIQTQIQVNGTGAGGKRKSKCRIPNIEVRNMV